MELDNIEPWVLLAGLGLFLFGMFMLEEAIKNLAGRAFRKFLRKHTGNRFKAVGAGILTTALLQSSSLVTLMVLAFCGAGIIQLQNGIGIIIGSNLGTTFTGWIVATLGFKLDINALVMPLLAIGGLGLIFLSKSDKLSNFSKFIAGLGFLFLGLGYMKSGISDFAAGFDATLLHGQPILVFFLAGFLLSGIIQSSSAVMVINLSALDAGLFPFPAAAALAIGADLGTTITAILGSVGGNTVKKRAAYSHLFFNLFTAALALLLLSPLLHTVQQVLGIHDERMGLVAFHSMFNLLGVSFFTIFMGTYTRFITRIIKEKSHGVSTHLALHAEKVSDASTEALLKESPLFFKQVLQFNKGLFEPGESGLLKSSFPYLQAYENIKKYESEVVSFYAAAQRLPLNKEESEILSLVILSVRNASLSAKYLKDVKHNLDELKNALDKQASTVYNDILFYQQHFYKQVESSLLIEDYLQEEGEMPALIEQNKEFSKREMNRVYEMAGTESKSEIETSSLLNLIMEIYNSNRSLIRSLSELKEMEKRYAVKNNQPD